MSATDHLNCLEKSHVERKDKRRVRTSVRCRVCDKRLGVIPNFEGRVFTLCTSCEKVLKAAEKGKPSHAF